MLLNGSDTREHVIVGDVDQSGFGDECVEPMKLDPVLGQSWPFVLPDLRVSALLFLFKPFLLGRKIYFDFGDLARHLNGMSLFQFTRFVLT